MKISKKILFGLILGGMSIFYACSEESELVVPNVDATEDPTRGEGTGGEEVDPD